MPPLISKWQQLPDSHRDLFPLLECFISIAQVLSHIVTLPFSYPKTNGHSEALEVVALFRMTPHLRFIYGVIV